MEENIKLEYCSNAGKKAYEMKVGIFALSSEELSEFGKKGGEKCKEFGLGFFSLTPEQKSENSKKSGKISSSQKWMCLETGHICNAGPLTMYQKARGIDTSKRIRIS